MFYLNKKISKALTTAVTIGLVAIGSSRSAQADTFQETYLAPGVQAQTQSSVCAGQSNCTMGVETFNELSTGTGSGFISDFGNPDGVTATFSGNYQINNADQYGGAGGNGKYIVTFDHNSGYTMTLSQNVNYFGMDLTALDGGNDLYFYNGNQLVGSYSPTNLISAIGSCPNGYCGNPNTGADKSEQFAFVNFYDQTGTFNKVQFVENSAFGGGYEADNFTVANLSNPVIVQGTSVAASPAPLPKLGASPLALIVLLVGIFRLRNA